jgi:riboflavin kinase/FMN adenylyltransferase
MLVLEGYSNVPDAARGSAMALGNFDGVHRGHQGLITLAVEKARELNVPAAVMLFEPHPREFFKPEEAHFHLTSLPQKLIELEKLGINLAVVIPFDREFATLPAEDFIARVLVQSLGISHVVIGYDFFYGAGRKGTPDLMWRAGEELRFGVSVLAPVAHDGEVISSSGIRLKLAQGDVKGAAEGLGRNWRVAGQVVGGAKRGTGLGFPTANVPMPRGTSLGHGIYAVRAHVDGQVHAAAAYLGTRPTFDNGMPVLEVFLFDFDGDLYGHTMEVEFVAHIREDRKFDSPEALVAQMQADCAEARRILEAAV